MKTHFATNLKKLRLQKNLSRGRLAMNINSQQRLASDFIGIVWVVNIQDWEAGHEPSYERLIAIARYFNVTVDQLLTEEL